MQEIEKSVGEAMLNESEYEEGRDRELYYSRGLIQQAMGIELGPFVNSYASVWFPRVKDSEKKASQLYEKICKRLDSSGQRIRTQEEQRIARELRKNSQIDIKSSVWIGGICVDLFFPGLGARKHRAGTRAMRGLAIEINGGVHNHPVKMKKDEYRSKVLDRLHIGLTVIENYDFSSTVCSILDRIGHGFILDHRARKRIWKRIFAETLAVHATEEELTSVFGERKLKVKLHKGLSRG